MSDVEFFKSSDFEGSLTPDSQQNLADYCNKILAERGVRVSGDLQKPEASLPVCWWTIENPSGADTHTALLIDIRPIVRDTPEALLREIIRKWDDPGCIAMNVIVERARALLAKKE